MNTGLRPQRYGDTEDPVMRANAPDSLSELRLAAYWPV